MYEVNAETLVPGDIVLLESGAKIAADLRRRNERNLRIDESLLTGELLDVAKDALAILERDAPFGDRMNMAFAGTLVTTGRGRRVVVATGGATVLGEARTRCSGERRRSPRCSFGCSASRPRSRTR